MTELIGTLGFLSIFHILGGIALGSTVRGLRNGFEGSKLFFLVWGSMFGCMPLAIGAQTFAEANTMYLFVIEILILAGAIAVTAFTPDWILESFTSPDVVTIEMGGLFLFIGVVVGVSMLKTNPLLTLLFGGTFAGAGAFLLYRGLRTIL